MNSVRSKLRFSILLGLFVATAFPGVASEKSRTPSADEIIRRVLERAREMQATTGTPAYTYSKVTITEEMDADGKVKQRKKKIYQVKLQGGATKMKLLEVNGRTPSDQEAREQAENEMNLQKLTGKNQVGNRDGFLTPELAARFDFELVGKKTIQRRPAYELKFKPKTPEPPVHRLLDRFLNRISGTLFIDTEEFEIAHADISLGSEVNLLGGVAGSLKKLAYSVTRTRVADGIWLNTSSTGDFEGRKLLDWTRVKTRSQSTNFRLARMTS